MAGLITGRRLLVALTVGFWALGCVVYGYYYVVTILALPEPFDAYTGNWQFQVLMFALVRLPLLCVGLALLIPLELMAFNFIKDRRASAQANRR